MKILYPILILKDSEKYLTYCPDLGLATENKDLIQAIEDIQEECNELCIELEENDSKLPKPSDINKLTTYNYLNMSLESKSFIIIDTDKYKAKHQQKTIRKNVTIPSYLNEFALSNNINCSKVLREALEDIYNK